VSNNLAVDVREEHVTCRLQRVLQFLPVFDDSVVHDIHRTRAVGVRMRVALRDTSVRSPAGVADPDARKVACGNARHALDQLRDPVGAAHLQRTTGYLLNCDTDGIVASVFECLERLTEVLGGRICCATRNDSAHQDTVSDDTRAGRAWAMIQSSRSTAVLRLSATPRTISAILVRGTKPMSWLARVLSGTRRRMSS
jgi:hypothetical protein